MKNRINKCQAVVLHTLKYRDSSLLVYAYTDLFGRQTYVVNGVRNVKNKTGMACFQPLTLLEIVAYHNPKTELQRLKEYRIAEPLQSLSFDVHKNAIALFIGEIMYKTVCEQESNSALFRFLRQAVIDLDNIQDGVANFHLYFLAQLCEYLGYAPGNEYAPDQLFFDIPTGMFTSVRPMHTRFFDTEQTQLLGHLLAATPADLCRLPLNREQRQAFISRIIDFYNHHFNTLAPIRSLPVLMEVYD
ncbi:MAG: DNA repair protein RecO [Prevotellaceae bacterium]|jgi:DNA repair protein RecO (recombination protein O)|nr:DNA repair protein RecO [Prevotellaceae bacterium]